MVHVLHIKIKIFIRRNCLNVKQYRGHPVDQTLIMLLAVCYTILKR